MLIKALNDYYDILEQKGEVVPRGYTKQKISFLICLRQNGEIEEIIDIRDKSEITDNKGKIKTVYLPREEIMPERSQKPGIDLNIIEHRPLYIFGLNYVNEEFTTNDKTDKAKKSHEIFVKGNLAFIEGMDSPLINAYREFLLHWNPEEQVHNPYLKMLGKEYSNNYYAFSLSGFIDRMLHNDPYIKKHWDDCYNSRASDPSDYKSQCSINGEYQSIARIHDKIKGVRNCQASGGVLVSYKNSSETSYGKEQSFNSNISTIAMKKYTEAMNNLLADPLHRTYIDDLTIVHWAQTTENKDYDLLVKWMAFDDKLDDEKMNIEIKGIFEHLLDGVKADYETLKIDDNTYYYIVGMTPNNSRISVRFIMKDKFGNIVNNIVQHQKDIAISENAKQIPIWRIRNELISPKSSNEKSPSTLMAELLQAVIYGTDYPLQLLSTLIRRVKTDSDTEDNDYIKLNAVRAGMIKGCINRKLRIYKEKEEIKMALDPQNSNPAYLCGRLFALLEKIQQEASNSVLNKTIKDTYFASACSTPAVVFPRLLILAQNHLSKMNNERYGFFSNYLGKIMNMLEGKFPQTLSLIEQGMFILGYYHQYYFRKEKSENKEEIKNGSN